MGDQDQPAMGWGELVEQAMAGDVVVIIVLFIAAAVVGWILGKAKALIVALILALAVGWAVAPEAVDPEAVASTTHVVSDGLLGMINQVTDNVRNMEEEHRIGDQVSSVLNTPPPVPQ